MVAQQQEALASVMKGKRTKRPSAASASLSPAPFTALADEGGPQNSSDISSVEWANTGPHNTEEEDMAHCLILLAQGSKPNDNTKNNNMNHDDDDINTSSSNKGIAATTYECKTCNKSFPSFQALGGHRASHKKPKLSIALPDHQAKKSTVFFSLLHDHHHHHHDDGQFNDQEIALSLQLANGGASSSAAHNNNNNISKAKIHECSICGAEFSSGQALGGHMRRHRPIGGTTPTSIPSPSLNLSSVSNNREQEKTRNNILSLDLNLPAPEDEHQHQHRDHSTFVFPSNEKTLVFSASSLVDCHY